MKRLALVLFRCADSHCVCLSVFCGTALNNIFSVSESLVLFSLLEKMLWKYNDLLFKVPSFLICLFYLLLNSSGYQQLSALIVHPPLFLVVFDLLCPFLWLTGVKSGLARALDTVIVKETVKPIPLPWGNRTFLFFNWIKYMLFKINTKLYDRLY